MPYSSFKSTLVYLGCMSARGTGDIVNLMRLSNVLQYMDGNLNRLTNTKKDLKIVWNISKGYLNLWIFLRKNRRELLLLKNHGPRKVKLFLKMLVSDINQTQNWLWKTYLSSLMVAQKLELWAGQDPVNLQLPLLYPESLS